MSWKWFQITTSTTSSISKMHCMIWP